MENLPDESWAPVPSYEDTYEVSDKGRVKRLPPLGPRIVTSHPVGAGYMSLRLCVNNVRKQFYVHTLVLEAFVGPRPEGHEADHINSDIEDNRLENLRWLDRRSNRTTTAIGEASNLSVLDESQVREIKRLLRDTDLTHREIAERFPVGRGAVTRINSGGSWAHVQI